MSWRHKRLRRLILHRRKKSLFVSLARLIFFGTIATILLIFLIFPILASDLPSPDKVVRREGFSTKIYDRNGVLLYDIYETQRRSLVTLDQVPVYLRQATIAIEDKNFYKHSGFDLTGILRALWNIVVHRRLQGGSTLTQQLVKNVLLSPQRTLTRKIKEFILAVEIERKYSKDQILQMYLNEAPYGGTAWGVEAAAELYFDKKVSDLTLVESAVLAGLPQRPSYYSPYGTNPHAYIGRTQEVLRRMREDGYITRQQEEEALSQLASLSFAGRTASFKAPHFVQYVQDILEKRYGEERVLQGGLKVITTLDWNLQKQVQEIVSEEIAKVESLHIANGAAIVLDPSNGQILAMVGSKDFFAKDYDGQVNVVLSKRQPGSAIKPITYVTALRKGYTAATLLMDTPTVFPGGGNAPDYKPQNYDGKFRGPIQMRYALGNSVNIPAVKMLALVGLKDMLKMAYDLGITTLEPTPANLSRLGLSVTLGGGEVRLIDLAAAYQAFANAGIRYDPVAILKVEDQNGKVLEEYRPVDGQKVLSAEEAFIISDILSDNNARADVFGLHSALVVPGRTVAVKTGTTNDRRDNWTIGWTPQVVVGVWVGNNDNSPMKSVASGITGAAPIWRRIIQTALEGKPNVSFVPPAGIVTAEVDSVSGYLAHDGFPSRTEYFIRGTEPTGEDPVHVKLKVCKTGKLATPSQIASSDFEEKEFFIFKEEDPFGPPNRWQEGIDQYLAGQTDPRYHPPSEYCEADNPADISFVTPKDKERIDSDSFEISVDPRSTSDIVEVEIEINGQKYLLTSAPWKVQVAGIPDGVYQITASTKDKDGHTADRKITVGVKTSPLAP